MARKGSAGSRARQVALTALREALERGEIPVEAPELVQGDYRQSWVGPDGKVYVLPTRGPSPERARRQRVPAVQLVIDRCGAPAGAELRAPDWRERAPWTDDTSRLCHWQAADGSSLVIDEL